MSIFDKGINKHQVAYRFFIETVCFMHYGIMPYGK